MGQNWMIVPREQYEFPSVLTCLIRKTNQGGTISEGVTDLIEECHVSLNM